MRGWKAGLLATCLGCGALADSGGRRSGGSPENDCPGAGCLPSAAEPLEELPPEGTPSPVERRCGADGVVWESVTLTEQADVDALEGCERVAGDLTLRAFADADLAPLLSLTQVDGRLTVYAVRAEDSSTRVLDGFASLEQVYALNLQRLQLSSLAPLGSLQRITGNGVPALDIALPDSGADVEITGCSGLTDLSGLGALSQVRSIALMNNPDLTSLSGLSSARIESVYSRSCPLLDLEGIESVLELSIFNSELVGLTGLGDATELRRLYLWNNPSLTTLQGGRVAEHMAEISITGNDALTDLRGLENLRSLDTLDLSDHPELRELTGLDGLEQAGTLSVLRNPSLTRVNSLGALLDVQALDFHDDFSLADLRGPTRLRSVGSLVVANAPALQSLGGLGSASIGRLLFTGVAATSLAGLEGVSVTGALGISHSPLLTSLDGLPQLSATATLEVYGAPTLSDAEALGALTALGQLTLENVGLIDLDALQNLRELTSLTVRNNRQLVQIDGLRGLSRMTFLEVAYNDALRSLPTFSNLVSSCSGCAPLGILVTQNPLLETGPGLPLVENADFWEIYGNPRLTTLPAYGSLEQAVSLSIQDNVSLVSLGLPLLQRAGRLLIRGNHELDDTTLAPLRALQGAQENKIVSNLPGPSRLDPCPWTNDGICDEQSGDCASGTDLPDCAELVPP